MIVKISFKLWWNYYKNTGHVFESISCHNIYIVLSTGITSIFVFPKLLTCNDMWKSCICNRAKHSWYWSVRFVLFYPPLVATGPLHNLVWVFKMRLLRCILASEKYEGVNYKIVIYLTQNDQTIDTRCLHVYSSLTFPKDAKILATSAQHPP
jgi:hypothetical protein